MRKPFLIVLSLSLLVGCTYKDNTRCVVTEAYVSYEGNGRKEPFRKYIFVHDGSHYTEIRGYRYETATTSYSRTASEVTKFTLVEDRLQSESAWEDGATTPYARRTYEYTTVDHVVSVIVKNYNLRDGNESLVSTYTTQYVEAPEDGVQYLITDPLGNLQLQEYKNGNLIKVAVESDNGSISSFGRKWAYASVYSYDSNPNVVKNFPVISQLLTVVPNAGNCTNNAIENLMLVGEGSSISQTQAFFFNNGFLETYKYDPTGRMIEFVYQCR